MKGVVLIIALVVSIDASAQTKRRVLVQLWDNSNIGNVVGGLSSGRWIPWSRARSWLKGQELFQLYTPRKRAGKARANKPKLSEASGDAYQVTFPRMKREKLPRDVIALTGASRGVMPRKPALIKADASHQAAVRSTLRSLGVKVKQVHIDRVWRVDLDGDGRKEDLVESTSPDYLDQAETPQDDGYSLILMLEGAKKKRSTVVIAKNLAAQLKAPPKKKSEFWGKQHYRLSHVLDLDGDGRLEVLLSWNYYEGGGMEVFTVRRGRPVRVLSVTDGA